MCRDTNAHGKRGHSTYACRNTHRDMVREDRAHVCRDTYGCKVGEGICAVPHTAHDDTGARHW